MPAAIPVVVGAWTAIGSLGIVGAALQGAIIGAAIGGLSSAVMGGDIGKGILYGAVGGAVTGGLGAAFSGASVFGGGLEGMSTVYNTAQSGASGAYGAASDLSKFYAAGTSKGGSVGAGLSKNVKAIEKVGSGGGLTNTLVEGGMQLVGGMLQGSDAERMGKDKLAWQAEQNRLDRIANEKLTKIRANASGGSGDGLAIAKIQQETEYKKLGEQRRQYDVARSDVETKRKRAGEALRGVRAAKNPSALAGQASFEEAIQPSVEGGMLQAEEVMGYAPGQEMVIESAPEVMAA